MRQGIAIVRIATGSHTNRFDMPGGGAKPGERRGGRKKGTPNKRTQGRKAAEQAAEETAKEQAQQPGQSGPQFNSLDMKRRIVAALFTLVVEENNKKSLNQKWDPKWLLTCLEAADRAVNGLLPYDHRRLGQVAVDVEALMKRDGSLHVTIASRDADL